MRIAFRRPDGAWDFGDSLTPFKPAGVNDIETPPSPSVRTSEFSFSQPLKDWEVKKSGCEAGYGSSSTLTLPPPAYGAGGHSDGDQSSA